MNTCKCGSMGRYQNMINGYFIWTCGTHGCLKYRGVTTSSSTNYQYISRESQQEYFGKK